MHKHLILITKSYFFAVADGRRRHEEIPLIVLTIGDYSLEEYPPGARCLTA